MRIDSKFFEQKWVVAITAEFGAVGQLAVIHLMNSVFESPQGYWRHWDTMERHAFTAQVPGLTIEMLDALVARLVEYGIVSDRRLKGHGVLTSAWLQREFVRQCGVGCARRLRWREHAELNLRELRELGIVPAESDEDAGGEEAPPIGEPVELPLRHPDRNGPWRRVRVRCSSPLRIWRLVKVTSVNRENSGEMQSLQI